MGYLVSVKYLADGEGGETGQMGLKTVRWAYSGILGLFINDVITGRGGGGLVKG